VHRDVKPGNVLFDEAGNVHLTDFGIARLTDVTAITSTGLVIGTPAYLAPEQVTGEGAKPASDVYALGLVLIEALTGERAFPGPPSEAALARLHRPPDVPPTRNRSLGPLLAAMTASEQHLRPEAASVADALTVASASEAPADSTMVLPILNDATAAVSFPVEAIPAAAGAPVVLQRRRSRAGLVIVLAIALVLLVGFATSRGGGGIVPANAAPTTTVAPPATTVPVTAPPTTAPPATTPAPKKKGKKGD
jgi:serine/threonine protein kinase